jgi:hypothetical protein
MRGEVALPGAGGLLRMAMNFGRFLSPRGRGDYVRKLTRISKVLRDTLDACGLMR